MDSTFNVTEWVLKNTIKEGKKENTYKFIEHVVNNLFPLNEYSDKEVQFLMNKFKEEADDYNITINKEIEDKIIELEKKLETDQEKYGKKSKSPEQIKNEDKDKKSKDTSFLRKALNSKYLKDTKIGKGFDFQ